MYLNNFPPQAAIDKVKEADHLVAMNKINQQDKHTMEKNLSTMSYALQGTLVKCCLSMQDTLSQWSFILAPVCLIVEFVPHM